MNLAELISDSESELAFVVAHELGHIIQAHSKPAFLFNPNAEWDADVYGMLLSLGAGYDPYGAAGALAKLAMASGDAGLLSQEFDNLFAAVGIDLHGSFNTRIDRLFTSLQLACASPQVQAACAQYKALYHPHLPTGVPLVRGGAVE